MPPFKWRRQDPAVLRSEDDQVAISILRMPASVDVERVRQVVVYVAAGPDDPVGTGGGPPIDEETRQALEVISSEYPELCDRLFAGDSELSYGSPDDFASH